jgi:lysozyme
LVIESQRLADDPQEGVRPGRTRRRKRWPVVVGAVLVVVLGALAFVWFVTIPRLRPDLRAGEVYGIDVSNHQGRIDWNAVAGDDISAVYMKATEGQDWVDKRFAENWTGAASAGLRRGAYHFFSLCSPGAAQAENFLKAVPDDPQALPPALDLEFAGCDDRPDKATFQREVTAFVRAVEAKTGKPLILYAMPSFTEAYPLPDDLVRERWVRALINRPGRSGWSIWQVSSRSRVHGIDEPVDLDVFAPSSLS